MKYDSFLIYILTLVFLKGQNRFYLPRVSLSRLKIPVSLLFGYIQYRRNPYVCMHLLTSSVFNSGTGLTAGTPQFWLYWCWFQWSISRWELLARNKCHCHKFKAELKITYIEFRIFLFLVKMISSLEYFARTYLPDLIPVCQIFTCFDTRIEQQFIHGHP